jgi:hypothetical protein
MPFGCSTAVSTAVTQLPSSHAAIVRVQVVRGDFRPVTYGGSLEHVVFSYSDKSRVAVPLYVDTATGEMVPGELGAY